LAPESGLRGPNGEGNPASPVCPPLDEPPDDDVPDDDPDADVDPPLLADEVAPLLPLAEDPEDDEAVPELPIIPSAQ
jgi:hypothetical protein